MIRTYTPTDLVTLTLPGDLPGLLQRGSPAVYAANGGRVLVLHVGSGTTDVFDGAADHRVQVPRATLALDLSTHAGRSRVVAWLAEGGRCLKGHREMPNAWGCGCHGNEAWIRRPADLRWALDWPGLPGSLPAWQSAAILHASALRVSKGRGAVDDTFSPWFEAVGPYVPTWYRRSYRHNKRTPPMQPEDRAEWDARWLADDIALLDGSTLSIEVPRD